LLRLQGNLTLHVGIRRYRCRRHTGDGRRGGRLRGGEQATVCCVVRRGGIALRLASSQECAGLTRGCGCGCDHLGSQGGGGQDCQLGLRQRPLAGNTALFFVADLITGLAAKNFLTRRRIVRDLDLDAPGHLIFVILDKFHFREIGIFVLHRIGRCRPVTFHLEASGVKKIERGFFRPGIAFLGFGILVNVTTRIELGDHLEGDGFTGLRLSGYDRRSEDGRLGLEEWSRIFRRRLGRVGRPSGLAHDQEPNGRRRNHEQAGPGRFEVDGRSFTSEKLTHDRLSRSVSGHPEFGRVPWERICRFYTEATGGTMLGRSIRLTRMIEFGLT
jgi:hypothetical protein